MELQHSFTVPADVDTAWATLLDLQEVAGCFPGATLTGLDDPEFTGQVKVKLGPVSLQYTGKGRFVERDDATHRAVIEAQGRDRRGNGTAGATVVAQLAPAGDTLTRVTVDTRLKVTGRPAQFGRGVMQDVGSRLVDQFAESLARQLAGPGEPAATPSAPEPVAAPAPSSEGVPSCEAAPSGAGPSGAGPSGAGPSAGPSAEPSPRTPRPPAPRPAPPAPGTETAATPPAGVAAGLAATLGAGRTADQAGAAAVAAGRDPGQGELDLGAVVLPVLARKYGRILLIVLITAAVTWVVARRRR